MSTFPIRGLFALLLAAAFSAPAARASSLLPLATEEAATLASGSAEVVLGATYFDDLRFPPFRKRRDVGSQSLLAAPQIGFRIAAGSWAEIQATYELLRLQEVRPGSGSDTTFGSGDARLATKVAVFRERDVIPAIGLRFATKLPNADDNDHLGTDEIDFGIEALLSKDFGAASVHSNLGLQLLGNPRPEGGQDDLFSYSVAVASKPLGSAAASEVFVRFVAELTGLAGSRFDNDRTAVRGGLQFHTAVVTLYGGVSAGLQGASEDYGVSGGFLFTFRPADLVTGGTSDDETPVKAAPAADDGWTDPGGGWIE